MAEHVSLSHRNEKWGSKVGLILGVVGCAVGMGNFLRFPRQVALNGGGAFMFAYFIALIFLGFPLAIIEWGLGRQGGKYGKGHIPGMFAAIWKHPISKYLGSLGLAVPFIVLTYYTYIESWTLTFSFFSLFKTYWGLHTEEEMSNFLDEYLSSATSFSGWLTWLSFIFTLTLNFFVISKGINKGIEVLSKIAMPVLLLFAIILVVVVFLLPPQPGIGKTALDGLYFLYTPQFDLLLNPEVWIAAASQIFFTLSVGLGSLATYASYLKSSDDIIASSLSAATINEVVEVLLGGSIAIPASVVFFGVTGAIEIAQSGSFSLVFVTMPVVFQQVPLGNIFGFVWFILLFIAGITSSVSLATPILAFFHEEYGFSRENITWSLYGVTLFVSSFHVVFISHGFMDEWDYWAGISFVVLALIEIVIFIWIFGSENAWDSIHLGSAVSLPRFCKWILVVVTPTYLILMFLWWLVTDTWKIIILSSSAGGGVPTPENIPYIIFARVFLVAVIISFAGFIWYAWKKNHYNDRKGFIELADYIEIDEWEHDKHEYFDY